MKIILDTNVVIAAFATQGLCHALFELCIDQHEVILSQEIMKEILTALEKKLKMPHHEAQRVSNYLREHAEIRPIKGPCPGESRDASDDHILALAEQVAADFIITGDEDLIILGGHRGIPIVQPRKFWEILRNRAGDAR